jgi:hypothetical protein
MNMAHLVRNVDRTGGGIRRSFVACIQCPWKKDKSMFATANCKLQTALQSNKLMSSLHDASGRYVMSFIRTRSASSDHLTPVRSDLDYSSCVSNLASKNVRCTGPDRRCERRLTGRPTKGMMINHEDRWIDR